MTEASAIREINLCTILGDAASQVDRARPADERNGPQWDGPGEEWFRSFEETVVAQVKEAARQRARALADPSTESYGAAIAELAVRLARADGKNPDALMTRWNGVSEENVPQWQIYVDQAEGLVAALAETPRLAGLIEPRRAPVTSNAELVEITDDDLRSAFSGHVQSNCEECGNCGDDCPCDKLVDALVGQTRLLLDEGYLASPALQSFIRTKVEEGRAEQREADARCHELLNSCGMPFEDHGTEQLLTIPQRIECLVAEYQELQDDDGAPSPTHGGWRSVKDDPPPTNERVLVWWPQREIDDEGLGTGKVVGGSRVMAEWDGKHWDEPEWMASKPGAHYFGDDWEHADEPILWVPIIADPVDYDASPLPATPTLKTEGE